MKKRSKKNPKRNSNNKMAQEQGRTYRDGHVVTRTTQGWKNTGERTATKTVGEVLYPNLMMRRSWQASNRRCLLYCSFNFGSWFFSVATFFRSRHNGVCGNLSILNLFSDLFLTFFSPFFFNLSFFRGLCPKSSPRSTFLSGPVYLSI